MRWLLSAFLFSAIFCYGANAAQWELIETNETYAFYYDKAGIGRAKYPSPATLSPPQKTVMQVWVKAIAVDPTSKKLAEAKNGRQLWIFDCDGSAGTLAWATSFDFEKGISANASYDFTPEAKLNGVDPYLHVVPPNSFGDAVQKIVCAKKK